MACKSYRVSLGLVAALAIALLCNAYLIILLFSSGGSNINRLETARPILIRSIPAIKFNSSLNLSYLNFMLNSTKRLPSKRTGALISLMNKIKRELIPRGVDEQLIADILGKTEKWVSSSWLIPPFAELGDVIEYLRTASIIKASVPRVGTQLKVMLTLEGGRKALLKPQWYTRSTQIEGTVYSGADRHNGEIVSFYLSLLLGLRRTPVAVGRRINLSTEILAKADSDMAATFFKNNKSDTCFYGVCRYCKMEASVCAGPDDIIEAAIILWLPASVKLKSYRSPWQRTYKKNQRAKWETDDSFCTKLQNESKIFRLNQGNRRLLDLIEASVFDFLISNGDRHHYETIDGFPDASVLLLDNGKSFGRSDVDHLDILAPLYQCCVIRKSLFSRLELVERGPLGALIQELTLKDPLYPLLTDDHIQAINRRLVIVMQTIELCAKVKSWDNVLIP